MVMTTHEDTIKGKPDLIRVFLEIHRKATEYAMSNRAAFVDMTVAKLGQPRATVELAAPNVELTWDVDNTWVTRAKYYGTKMLELKQIRQLPDYGKFINTSFVEKMRKA
jgi:NitT/TauT family transport system substrate-binding protein